MAKRVCGRDRITGGARSARVALRSGAINGVNFGGGVNYWFRERVGLRLEFRDQVGIELEGPSSHFYGLRVGLSFR